MLCEKCGSKMKVDKVIHISFRLTVRYIKCTKKGCKFRVKSTETY